MQRAVVPGADDCPADAVAQEVDAVERLGAGAAAEIDELVGAGAVGLFAAPTDGPGRQVLYRFGEVLASVVGIIVPARFDRAVGDAERLHELHVEVRRYVEQRFGIDDDGVRSGGQRSGASAVCWRNARRSGRMSTREAGPAETGPTYYRAL